MVLWLTGSSKKSDKFKKVITDEVGQIYWKRGRGLVWSGVKSSWWISASIVSYSFSSLLREYFYKNDWLTDLDSKSWAILIETSLKIFKHYKLKPSFSIIKDEKGKDKVGVGDDPMWSSLIQFSPIQSN